VREIAECADNDDGFCGRQAPDDFAQLISDRGVVFSTLAHRGPPDRLQKIENPLTLLLTDRITKQLTKKLNILLKRSILFHIAGRRRKILYNRSCTHETPCGDRFLLSRRTSTEHSRKINATYWRAGALRVMDNGRSSHPSSLFWKDHKSETLAEADLENAAFTIFLYGRMIGAAAEIDDHINRGRNMDTRTPIQQCGFVV